MMKMTNPVGKSLVGKNGKKMIGKKKAGKIGNANGLRRTALRQVGKHEPTDEELEECFFGAETTNSTSCSGGNARTA